MALVSFLARPNPRIPFLGLSLLRNQTETLATQARLLRITDYVLILLINRVHLVFQCSFASLRGSHRGIKKNGREIVVIKFEN